MSSSPVCSAKPTTATHCHDNCHVTATPTGGPVRPRVAAPLLITLQAASRLLGLPETSLRDLAFKGVLSVVRPGGTRRWWLRRDEVIALVDKYTERLG